MSKVGKENNLDRAAGSMKGSGNTERVLVAGTVFVGKDGNWPILYVFRPVQFRFASATCRRRKETQRGNGIATLFALHNEKQFAGSLGKFRQVERNRRNSVKVIHFLPGYISILDELLFRFAVFCSLLTVNTVNQSSGLIGVLPRLDRLPLRH